MAGIVRAGRAGPVALRRARLTGREYKESVFTLLGKHRQTVLSNLRLFEVKPDARLVLSERPRYESPAASMSPR